MIIKSNQSEYIDLNEYFEKKYGPLGFNDYLRAARAHKDMTQVQMAKFLGVSKSTLCDIEKGRQLVSPALAAKIAKKCGLSIPVAIQCSLQDQLKKAKLNYTVEIA